MMRLTNPGLYLFTAGMIGCLRAPGQALGMEG